MQIHFYKVEISFHVLTINIFSGFVYILNNTFRDNVKLCFYAVYILINNSSFFQHTRVIYYLSIHSIMIQLLRTATFEIYENRPNALSYQ